MGKGYQMPEDVIKKKESYNLYDYRTKDPKQKNYTSMAVGREGYSLSLTARGYIIL